MSDLVGNPEDRISQNEAQIYVHIMTLLQYFQDVHHLTAIRYSSLMALGAGRRLSILKNNAT